MPFLFIAGFTWVTDFTYLGTNPAVIYGGDSSGDDLIIRANSADALPEIYIYGSAGRVVKMGTGHDYIWLGDAAGTYTWNICDNAGAVVLDVDSLGNLRNVGSVASSNVQTFTDGDLTPSVANGKFFIIPMSAGGPRNLTMFDNGIQGQEITVQDGAGDGNTTVIDGGALNLAGNWAPNSIGDNLSLWFDGGAWYETGRVDV